MNQTTDNTFAHQPASPANKANVLGVILARAGSQGLKDKHLLPLLGRMVIDYTFDAAQQATLLTHTVVSTDCPRILSRAQSRGLPTIDRPAALSGSDASVQDVMLHALQQVEQTTSVRFDAAVVLYGNIPARPTGVIDQAVELLLQTGCDSVRSFCPVGKWHPQWMVQLREDRVHQLATHMGHKRQDLPPLYLHDGAALVVSRASLLRALATPDDPHAFFGVDRRGVRTQPDATVEIDQRRDLFWAEAVLRERSDPQPKVA